MPPPTRIFSLHYTLPLFESTPSLTRLPARQPLETPRGPLGAAMADPAEAQRSSHGDFNFLRELGRGSWGMVLLAQRKVDGGLYAVKVVRLQNRSCKEQMDAVQEAQVGGRNCM